MALRSPFGSHSTPTISGNPVADSATSRAATSLRVHPEAGGDVVHGGLARLRDQREQANVHGIRGGHGWHATRSPDRRRTYSAPAARLCTIAGRAPWSIRTTTSASPPGRPPGVARVRRQRPPVLVGDLPCQRRGRHRQVHGQVEVQPPAQQQRTVHQHDTTGRQRHITRPAGPVGRRVPQRRQHPPGAIRPRAARAPPWPGRPRPASRRRTRPDRSCRARTAATPAAGSHPPAPAPPARPRSRTRSTRSSASAPGRAGGAPSTRDPQPAARRARGDGVGEFGQQTGDCDRTYGHLPSCPPDSSDRVVFTSTIENGNDVEAPRGQSMRSHPRELADEFVTVLCDRRADPTVALRPGRRPRPARRPQRSREQRSARSTPTSPPVPPPSTRPPCPQPTHDEGRGDPAGADQDRHHRQPADEYHVTDMFIAPAAQLLMALPMLSLATPNSPTRT